MVGKFKFELLAHMAQI